MAIKFDKSLFKGKDLALVSIIKEFLEDRKLSFEVNNNSRDYRDIELKVKGTNENLNKARDYLFNEFVSGTLRIGSYLTDYGNANRLFFVGSEDYFMFYDHKNNTRVRVNFY
jgi:hypothetical protein